MLRSFLTCASFLIPFALCKNFTAAQTSIHPGHSLSMRPTENLQVEWIAHKSASGYSALSIAVDARGNVYVTGENGINWSDYLTVKYNADGIEQWYAIYEGGLKPTNVPNDIAVDARGNVYVTGESGAPLEFDYATVKYDSSGKEQWIQRYDRGDDDQAFALALDADGNLYVTGQSYGFTSSYDYCTFKYTTDGTILWGRTYDGTRHLIDGAMAIALDAKGNVYVTGGSMGEGTDVDYVTIKYDSSGGQKWIARYNGLGNGADLAVAIAVDARGNVYVTGYSICSGTDEDYVTVKYNSSGQEQWIACYNGPAHTEDRPTAIAVDIHGNVYVTGYSRGAGSLEDYATIKYDSTGREEWIARYDGPAKKNDRANALALDRDGNIYVTGKSVGAFSIYDYATIKYDPEGNEQWVARYQGTPNDNDVAFGINVDTFDNVYVVGRSRDGGNPFFTTIKYSQRSPSLEENEYMIMDYALFRNYPNPFNGVTTIRYSILKKGRVRLTIHDLLGREVVVLVDGEMSAGHHAVRFEGKRLPGGIYYYRMLSGDFMGIKRCILLK